MAQKVDVSLPPDVRMGGSWRVEWAAVDPVTGADVSGVKITAANVVGDDVSGGGTSGETIGPFMLVPGPGA